MIVNKRKKSYQIVDAAIPEDGKVRYLVREVRKLCGLKKVKVIPVVMGELVTMPSWFKEYLKEI